MRTNRLMASLSALIFIAYGLFSQSSNRTMFIYLGVVFIIIALADYLKKKK
ncbi:hypothetical protein [Streptococcus cuniculipharyngis]|uniref:hypothetical protein n=1 Tax=Streptococcus cuniculipharyngis TaxID=1562651 RepID=UPI00164930B2|nr:hypothetical protein [Streptococcus cuniculipharyngis]